MRALVTSLLLGSALIGVACRARTSSPVASRPAANADRACADCHTREAEEWSASLHRAAFTDRDFQISFAHEPDDFCFRCHAPEARDRSDVPGIAKGVGCPSCHVVAEGHGVEHVKAATRDCAGCHEFSFPSRPALMQSTASEHAKSAFAADPCAACHLPRAADGHRDHRFDVSRNVALLRSALDVAARRTTAGVAIRLTTRNVGHAMPTGDLFRRLRIVVRGEDERGQPLAEEEVLLSRRFDRRRGLTVEIDDTRILGQREVDIDADWIGRAAHVDVEIRYERVAQTMDVIDVRGQRGHRDVVFASELLANLRLPGGIGEAW